MVSSLLSTLSDDGFPAVRIFELYDADSVGLSLVYGFIDGHLDWLINRDSDRPQLQLQQQGRQLHHRSHPPPQPAPLP